MNATRAHARTPVSAAPPDGVVMIGRLVELLALNGPAGVDDALRLLADELGLRSARISTFPPIPAMRLVSGAPALTDIPLHAGGSALGTLRVAGARAYQLPLLTTAAAVLALALRPPTGDVVEHLVRGADEDADEAAARLHDGSVQALVAARYAADAVVRGADPLLARAAVQEALVELRRSLWHLRPRGRHEGLVQALRLLAGRLHEAGGQPLRCTFDEPLAARIAPAAVSTAYRLVQTVALAGGHGPLRVSLHRDGASAVLDLDGGVAPPGLARWSARVAALGGSLICSGGRTRLVLPVAVPTKVIS